MRDCGQPTGEPEARQKHLPIQDWKIDISDLERLWKENEIGFALRRGLIITTVERFKLIGRGYVFEDADRLMQLPGGQAIIVVIGPTGGFNPQNQTMSGPYVVVNAQSGEILVKATYVVPPPRP